MAKWKRWQIGVGIVRRLPWLPEWLKAWLAAGADVGLYPDRGHGPEISEPGTLDRGRGNG